MKPGKKHTAAFLSDTPMFAPLPKAILQETARHLARLCLPKGSRVSVQGRSTVDRIYIVMQGSLELYYEMQGRKILCRTLDRGEIFGGISILLNSGIAFRTVEAKTETTCLVLDKDKFLDLSARFPCVYESIADAFNSSIQDETYASVLNVEQTAQFLAGVIPFSFLPESDLMETAGRITTRQHPKETVLLVQDRSKLEFIYIIRKGAVERYYEKKRGKALRGVLGEGDLFGGISVLLNDGLAARTVAAVEDSLFLVLPIDAFKRLCRRYEAFAAFFTDTFGKQMLDRSYAEIFRRKAPPGNDIPPFFSQPLDRVCSRNPIACDATLSIREAAGVMSRHNCSSIFVSETEKGIVGLVTDNDLRQKVIARGVDMRQPVSDIMSEPLSTIPRNALVFEGLMSMMQKNIKHLAVTDHDGRVMGMVTNGDLIKAQGQSPLFLVQEIHEAKRFDQVKDKFSQAPRLIQSLIYNGAKAQYVTRLITTLSDAILSKIIRLSVEESGPPPARFVFMIMGSEGRGEQTLKTDQDNAIVFEDTGTAADGDYRAYFQLLGEKICTRLNRAGYAFCSGEVMARNPKWCQPVSVWKRYFSNWIHAADPEDLLNASIFFDFRGIYGERTLIAQLRQHLFHSLVGWEGFFRHLTENALRFKPPLGFFRNFVVESKGAHKDAFDIKSAMMPIVDFARIYALKHQVAETNTLDRLYQLRLKGVLTADAVYELEHSYSFLMQLRFLRQVEAIIEENRAPDNYIRPKKLSGIEQRMLKEIFKRIETFQTKLEFDFTGSIGPTP